ncbi:PmeII family type II restriction endonuclease [Caldibacillus debilis]|uniref:PmeII family type II restriction endonuclease n=1 Tax=Caldibacillus debilis TaxID=301148 RepID=UPI000779E4C7|nr:PmeII family type II restriction endonuclease [Caldibacillus debilis]
MRSAQEVENKIGELLDDFYRRRIEKIKKLKLKDTLKRKNPYLFRAIGTQKASEIVESLLTAYMSSSDEGIFGDAFFEPLAKYVSGGTVAPSEGVDIVMETKTTYTAIAVKSGPSVFNAQSKKRQEEDFRALGNRIRKLRKQFDPIVGYCYGKKRQKKETAQFRELAGQAFWEELTGDPDFYLKIIQLMKNKPQEHSVEFKKAWDAAINRFTREFVETFCDENGNIDWESLVKFNSGKD